MTMKELKDFLANVRQGRLTEIDQLSALLTTFWDEFEGSNQTKMEGWKLERDEGIEDVEWNPPCLRFIVIRHGAMVVGGSGRGERQQWILDMSKNTADCYNVGYRQILPKQPALDVKPIAAELAAAVVSGIDDERIRRRADGTVRVQVGMIVPDDGPQQTVIGRRKRLRAALKRELEQRGWEQVQGGHGWRFAPRGH
jgi:hypothetical protein